MKLVVDAGVAIGASANPLGFQRFRHYELVAPPLMWIEAVSVLHAVSHPIEMAAAAKRRKADVREELHGRSIPTARSRSQDAT